ncbi:MAG TPA: ABC transporter permease [Candidatus Acidoferrum sp.]|nr:ABC transporter permease [Candidatus Acidoferrum sp.]
MLHRAKSWLRNAFHRSHTERDMDTELRFHIDAFTEDLIRSGVSREEAQRRARIEFGGLEQAKEECRDARGLTFLETLNQDIRYGLRIFRKNPGFTFIAILTLALGIGANTAIFSMINAVMLRSLPVRDPQQVVVFSWHANKTPGYHGYSSYGDCGRSDDFHGCSFSLPLFDTLRASDNKAFSKVISFSGPKQINVAGNGPASLGRGELVSGDFFETLGVEMFKGRPISNADDTSSSAPVAVLSYAYWKAQFASDPNILGRTIHLNNVPTTIIGVASPTFTNLAAGKSQDFFVPIHAVDTLNLSWLGEVPLTDSQDWWIVLVGRLKPGVTLEQAQSIASTFFYNQMLHGAKNMSKPEDNPSILLTPLNRGLIGRRQRYSVILYVLMSAVGLVLLIACANVAGLTLARSNSRQREIAVRLALGGARRRVARQLLTESLMLSVAGGVVGFFVAQWGVRALEFMLSSSSEEPFPFVASPDWRVFSFSLVISIVTGILFGLAPAMRLTKVSLGPALKESPTTFQGRAAHSFRLSGALVVTQVALSILVLVSAGLLVRTLQDLRSVDAGFDTSNVLLFAVDPSLLKYEESRTQNLYREIRNRLAALPGVTSASYASDALLSGSLSSTSYHIPGQPEKTNLDTNVLSIGPDFLETLRIPLLDGRTFTPADYATAAKIEAVRSARLRAKMDRADSAEKIPDVLPSEIGPPTPILVNQKFIDKFLPKQPFLGRLLEDQIGEENTNQKRENGGYEIVGLVGNTKYQDLRADMEPTVYLPLSHGQCHFEIRTASNPNSLVPTVRDLVNQVDSNLPIFDIRAQSTRIEDLLLKERIIAHLSSFFGILALLLACIGLYGLLAYEVARRTREIGVRVALGAQQRDVVGMVVKQGLTLVLIGSVFGIGAAVGLTKYLNSLLFGVKPFDPITFVSVVALLFVVALAACYIPARRASQVDPMIALRHE